MTFDQTKFQTALDQTNDPVRFNREGALNNIQDQFKNMSTAERGDALKLIMAHNEHSNVKVSVDLKGNAVGKVTADETVGTFFAQQRHDESNP